jgi:Na+/melibiose symporter-like transporter
MAENVLSQTDKRSIALLGLPSFGLALSSTVAVTFGPIIARQFTKSTAVVGSTIAIEGLVAFFLPVLVGTWSDHLRTRVGGRLPFLIAGLPVSALTLLLIGSAHSITELIICLGLFFVAYYVAYEPYRALYPDLISDESAGRAQSAQAVWRGVGTGVALTAGGFLLAFNQKLPFIVAAILTLLSSAVFLWILLRRHGVPKQNYRHPETIKGSYLDAINIIRTQPQLVHYLTANALWELTLGALKSFIILYLTVG